MYTHINSTLPNDSDRIQAQCEVAPGQALLEISRIDHTCYWFPFTRSPTHSTHTFSTVCLDDSLVEIIFLFRDGKERKTLHRAGESVLWWFDEFLVFRQEQTGIIFKFEKFISLNLIMCKKVQWVLYLVRHTVMLQLSLIVWIQLIWTWNKKDCMEK